jgi:superfamily I DNA/RNA helicase
VRALFAAESNGAVRDDVDPIEITHDAIRAAGLGRAIDAETDLVTKERMSDALDEVLNALGSWLDRVQDAKDSPDLDESHLVDTKTPPLVSFLDRIALDEEDKKKDKADKSEGPKGRVTLMSLHAAKGLEFRVVFLVGFEEGLLPHRRVILEAAAGRSPGEGSPIDEERRLAYVGITRAREWLTLSWARARRRHRRMIPREVSRFAVDLPDETVAKVGYDVENKTEAELAVDFFASIRAGGVAAPEAATRAAVVAAPALSKR